MNAILYIEHFYKGTYSWHSENVPYVMSNLNGIVLSQSEEMRTLSLSGHVGFDSLPDQLVSKSVSQGFSFNILCVGEENVLLRFCRPVIIKSIQTTTLSFTGETGIGKSTLMNTLFNTTFENEETSHFQNGVYLRPRTYSLQESNVDLQLTIVDTVGFGDQVNKEER